MPQSDLLADLTDAQAAAVTHAEGPLLILAGAGSGKTRVITRRVAYLLQSGVPAYQILAITFTNKAAAEMRKRVDAIVPQHRIWISTFHSLGARLLRQYADDLNIDRNFTIYDIDDRNKVIRDALASHGLDDVKFTADRLGGAISKAKNQLLSPKLYEAQAHDFFTKTVAKVYVYYEKKLRQMNGMDFDDLLYLPAMALTKVEDFRKKLDNRFRYVLIDEYQDTNQAQYEIARQLCRDHPNLCVVGDPDQSIYKWRGSDIKNILDFERDFPGAKVITLEQNYRSTKAILHAASVLIDRNRQRKKKSLTTDNPAGAPVRVVTYDNGTEEAEGVVLRIKEAIESERFAARDHAVFVRMNALTRTLESAFLTHGVPYQIVKGLAFFDRKENKDVLAYLRLLVNPQDSVSFARAVNVPPRGIGKVSLDALIDHADASEITLLDAVTRLDRIPKIRGKAVGGLKRFARVIAELRAALDRPLGELLQLTLRLSGYQQMLLDSGDEEDADRLANVEELVTAAQQFYDEEPGRTLADFLETITLASDVDGWDEMSDRVSVMTFHAAKGLEFPVVYMVATEHGMLPHQRSLESDDDIEEERRLCFVGMTRAMRELYLTHARSRSFRGQVMSAVPSMFLEELPPEVEHVDYSQSKNSARTSLEDWRAKVGMAPATLAPPKKPWGTPAAAAGEVDYQVGMVVDHEHYGVGQVTELSGFGTLRRVKVRFGSHGEKAFVAQLVKLKVVRRQ